MIHVVIADQQIHIPVSSVCDHVLHKHFKRLNVIQNVDLSPVVKEIAQKEDVVTLLLFGNTKHPIQHVDAVLKPVNPVLMSVKMKIREYKCFGHDILPWTLKERAILDPSYQKKKLKKRLSHQRNGTPRRHCPVRWPHRKTTHKRTAKTTSPTNRKRTSNISAHTFTFFGIAGGSLEGATAAPGGPPIPRGPPIPLIGLPIGGGPPEGAPPIGGPPAGGEPALPIGSFSTSK
jgi:hypothetical protein